MEENKIIIRGKLIKCSKKEKEFKGKSTGVRTFITLAEVELNDDQRKKLNDAFKESGNKFTPTWIKNFEGFVNLSSKYDIPVKVMDNPDSDFDDDYASIVDLCEQAHYPWYGSIVRMSINIKDGAVYPKAICIDKCGERYNPLDDFE